MPKKYHVFLSHNSADKPAVEMIGKRLADEAGLRSFLDKWHLIPGTPWQEALEEALEDSETIAVFVGPSGVSPWHNEEMRSAINLAVSKRDEYRVIPVLLPGANPDEVALFLESRTWVDFRSGIEAQEPFDRLVAGITGVPPKTTVHVLPDEPAPYRGLLRFGSKQTDFFFGRDRETEELINRIKRNSFLAIIGPSGSGKSSLVRAGLIPRLIDNALPGSKDWKFLKFTPGDKPLRTMAEQLSTLETSDNRLKLIDDIAERIETKSNGLREVVTGLLAEGDENLFILIDQFEELFTHCQDTPARCRQQASQFIDNLYEAVSVPDQRIRIVITMRADFMERALGIAKLKDLLQDRDYKLGPMDVDELREAIVRPAQKVGALLEKGLVHSILSDIEDQSGVLPLMQHALHELWLARKGIWLTMEAYERSRGVKGALQRRAQDTYESMSASQKDIARNIFLRLTSLGEGVSDTRRRVSTDELFPAGVDPDEVEHVLQLLSREESRLIVTDDQGVEVTHEALIQEWGQLQEWLDSDRDLIRAHRQLTRASLEWEALDRDPGVLFRGAKLNQAKELFLENLENLNKSEKDFLETSISTDDRQRRNARIVQISLVTISIVAVIAAIFATFSTIKANRQANINKSREMASISLSIAETNLDSALLLIAEGMQRNYNQQTQDSMLAILSWNPQLARHIHNRAEDVRDIALSPDGKILACASSDHMVRLFDFETGQLLGNPMSGHEDIVWSVAFNQDGSLLASGGKDGTLRLWDPDTGNQLGGPLTGHSDQVQSVVFSSDGKLLISASNDGTVRIWDPNTGKQIGEPLIGHKQPVLRVAINHDGSIIASGSDDNTLIFWDVQSRSMLHAPILAHDGKNVRSVAFNPSGTILATGGADGIIKLWDPITGEQIGEPLVGHNGIVWTLAFNREGTLLASSGTDKAIRLWDPDSGEQVESSFTDSVRYIWSILFSHDSKQIVAAGADHHIRLWDIEPKYRTGHKMYGHDRAVRSVVFNSDGTLLASGAADNSVIVWNPFTGENISGPLTGHSDWVRSLAFSPFDNLLISAAADGHLIFWDLSNFTEIARLSPEGDTPPIRSVVFHPQENIVATGSADGVIRFWDVEAQTQIGEPIVGHEGAIWSVVFSPDGTLLASGSYDKTIRLWDVKTRTQIGEALAGHNGTVWTVDFSVDGEMLASGGCRTFDENEICVEGEMYIWDVKSGKQIHGPITKHEDIIWSLAFNPNGTELATASGDDTIIIWDVDTWKPIGQPLDGHHADVNTVTYSPGGGILASGSWDTTVLLWEPDLEILVDKACSRAGRNLAISEWEQYFPEEEYRITCPEWPSLGE